jgi:GNAT superfamily N-acetyltransferase
MLALLTSIPRSSILTDVRALGWDEFKALEVIPAEYCSSRRLVLTQTSEASESSFLLREEKCTRQTRVMSDLGQHALEMLYGSLENLRFIGAFDGPRLIGSVVWRFDRWNELVTLCDIRVRTGHRRSGIGGIMLTELKWAAAMTEARGIMAETQDLNVAAVEFYVRSGFVVAGANRYLYGSSPESDSALYLFFPMG